MSIRTKLREQPIRAFAVALLALAVLPAAARATADLRDDLWLRIEDARGVANGEVAVVFRTETGFPIGAGRIVFAASLLDGAGGAGTPFSSCGGALVFADGDDALVSKQSFDPATQRFAFDFSSASGSVNAVPGVMAAAFCQIAPGAAADDRFELALVGGAGGTALADPAGVALPVDPRAGELRVRDDLDVELDAEDTEVKPGAVARVEIETEWAFAIESGGVDLELDPALVRDTPSVAAVPNHGAVSIDSQSWDAASGRFRFSFSSVDASLNAEIPGALFVVSVPTVADDSLLGQITPLTLIAADTFLVGPGASGMALELKDGVLLFTENPETEHVFEDGFSGGSSWGWDDLQPHD